MAGEPGGPPGGTTPPMVGAAGVAKRSRRILGSASAPALPGAAPPGTPEKPPTPPPAFSDRLRRRSFNEQASPSPEAKTREINHSNSSSKLIPGAQLRKAVAADSPNTTPRTPRSVEVSVEGQEVAVPTGIWAPDGHLEVDAAHAVCTITVKTGLSGKGGINVVLRVSLLAQEDRARFEATSESLSSWMVIRVAGSEECDIGRLPPRRDGNAPRAPMPGSCQHEFCEGADGTASEGLVSRGRSGEVGVQEALALGPSACVAEFDHGLTLQVSASCSVTSVGQATLRLEVQGDLRLRPRFWPGGIQGMLRLYKAARDHFRAKEDLSALQKCEEAVTIADALTPRPREMGDILNLMGALHLRRNSPGLAVKCLERALLVRERTASSSQDLGMAATLSTLGSAHQAQGAFVEALRCHERACSILEVTVGNSDPAYASALQSLGSVHRMLGNHADARAHFESALAVREKTLGPEHHANATTLNNLGATLQSLLDDRGAIRCYQRALAIEVKAYGRAHVTTAATLSNLGSAHGRLGEHQCAIDCHNRALTIQEDILGREHPSVAATLHNLGNALVASGNGQDAARCLWRALSIWSKALGPAHPDIAATLHSLGNVYRATSSPESAAKCFAGALRIREVVLGPTHPETARTRHCAALVGCALGEQTASLRELQAAAASLLASLGGRHPWVLQARADAESLQQAVSG